MKQCSKCKESKENKEFKKIKATKSGLSSWCRKCINDNRRDYRIRNRDKYLRERKEWWSKNKDRINPTRLGSARSYYNTNKDKINAKRKHRPYDPQKRKLIRYNNYEHYRLKGIQYRQERRARIMGNPSERFTTLEIAERDKWTCQLCHRKVSIINISIDHIIPLARGGWHTRDNVQLAHKGCNIKRGLGRIPAQIRLAI